MTNDEFLKAVQDSFEKFLEAGTSRSNAKLKPLHGAIADDLSRRLGGEFEIHSLGFGDEKESSIPGRYMEKKVDITISRGRKPVAGVAVKFVMQNYSQNSNNYFENMLGETANLRAGSIPYFQVFIIPDKIPYYRNDGTFSKWENLSEHNIGKYLKMDSDNPAVFFHTPDKLLFYPIHLPDLMDDPLTKEEYLNYYRTWLPMSHLQRAVIAFPENTNVLECEWEPFAEKVCHRILSL
jgi:hypothetical protein